MRNSHPHPQPILPASKHHHHHALPSRPTYARLVVRFSCYSQLSQLTTLPRYLSSCCARRHPHRSYTPISASFAPRLHLYCAWRLLHLTFTTSTTVTSSLTHHARVALFVAHVKRRRASQREQDIHQPLYYRRLQSRWSLTCHLRASIEPPLTNLHNLTLPIIILERYTDSYPFKTDNFLVLALRRTGQEKRASYTCESR